MNKPLLVFYLDDEPDLLLVFKELFSQDEVKIETFESPDQLKAAVLSEKPDLVFLDYRLKKTTGIEVAKELPKELPKYLITGELSPPSTDLFVATLTKPLSVVRIQEIIKASCPT